mgnify:CR=1 FL=1
MRITREMLHKFARQTVKQRKRNEPDLHAAYLVGSLLGDDPLLGGTADIDLVLVHKYQASTKRETEPITAEISLDIIHKLKEDYDQYRQLRHDPWMGYPLTHNHILLYDTDHWLEFIQSSVSAEFHRADNVLARVNVMAGAARENWFSLIQTPSLTHTEWLHRYLEIMALTANAVAGLIGPPLTTRRFMITFETRVDSLGVPKTLTGFLGLLGYSQDHDDTITTWVNAFENDLNYLSTTSKPPVHLAPCRTAYYLNALRFMIENGDQRDAIWPLLRTWLDVHLAAPKPTPGVEAWQDCLSALDLSEGSTSQKIDALDAYLDTVDILIESWADVYGI